MASRKFKSDLAKLKKAGLTRVDVRKAKETKYFKSLIKQNRDVIEGRAKVVKIKGARKVLASDITTRKGVSKATLLARGVKGRAKAGRVIVKSTSERPIRYSEKRGQFETTISTPAGNRKAIIVPSTRDFHNLEASGFNFRVPFARGKGKVDFRRYTDAGEMIRDMHLYEIGGYSVDNQGNRYKRTPYTDWQDYVQVYRP